MLGNTKRIIGIVMAVVGVALVAFGAKVLILDKQDSAISALRVDSIPNAFVYLDDQKVGQTPYVNEKLKAGEYTLKLRVLDTPGVFLPWAGRIKLLADSLTYVSREIGPDEDSSGGQILWLEKLLSGQKPELAVISEPDGAVVKVDAVEKGNTPLILRDLPVGDHEISVSREGYSDQIIKGRLVAGFRLNAAVKLTKLIGNAVASPSGAASPSANVATTAGEMAKPYVVIEETGTGFLRVRVDHSLNATEEAKVTPGEKYPLLSEISGWVEIKLATISGWVSDQYVKKVK